MLYEEFVRGTGCRENEHNYEVYKNLEVMYMHTDLSKEQIYEYGKKLVDNSLSKDQLEWNEEVNFRIRELKADIQRYQAEEEFYRESARCWAEYSDKDSKECAKLDRNAATMYRNLAKEARAKIRELKTLLYA